MKKRIFRRKHFDYFVSIPTRWRDMDGLRHINHAAYLTYMESARIEFYRHLGFDMERWDAKESTILASMKVDYMNQAQHPDNLEIGHRIIRIGNKSFDVLTAVFSVNNDIPFVQAEFTIVAFDYSINQAIKVPDVFINNFNPIE